MSQSDKLESFPTSCLAYRMKIPKKSTLKCNTSSNLAKSLGENFFHSLIKSNFTLIMPIRLMNAIAGKAQK